MYTNRPPGLRDGVLRIEAATALASHALLGELDHLEAAQHWLAADTTEPTE